MERLTYEQQVELHSKAKGGDRDARDKLIMGMKGWAVKLVHRYGMHYRFSSIEDCLQDAMLQVVRAVDLWDPSRGRLTTLIGRFFVTEMVHNIHLNQKYLRRRDCDKVAKFIYPDASTEQDDLADAIREAFNACKLDPLDREVIVRRASGESGIEIGKALGVSRQRVNQREQRAIKKLRKNKLLKRLAAAQGGESERERTRKKAPAGKEAGRAA